MEAKTFNPTPEMLSVLHLYTSTRNNIQVRSYAGTGKTTLAELLLANTRDNTLYVVFNTRNRDEAEERFAAKEAGGAALPPYLIKTVNGLGHSVWQETLGRKCGVNTKKTYELFNTLLTADYRKHKEEAFAQYSLIRTAVGLAKAFGYVPDRWTGPCQRLMAATEFHGKLEERPSSLARRMIDDLLLLSIKAAYAGNIDYDDQCYMSALFGGTFPRFPEVIGDEAQDFSRVNWEMFARLVARGARLTCMGDPYQSIYAFRGALTGGMAKARDRFDMTEASLSVSFRCPRAIVESVHFRVADMKWIKEGGHADRCLGPTLRGLPDGCAIISRNNAPLFALAIRLLTSGRSVTCSGSEIGPKILGIMKKFGPASLAQEEVYEKIEGWRQAKLAAESTTADDTADCMRVFADRGDTLGLALAYAEDLFRQSGTITLTTGHKAKGLEWPIVYHLDPQLITESDQDQNLKYVIHTRSLDQLYWFQSEEIR
jgi:hypothetical protein